MKQTVLNYKGYINSVFRFRDQSGKMVDFKKSRKELIDTYELMSKKNIGKDFLVKYFKVDNEDRDVLIMSDLALVE